MLQETRIIFLLARKELISAGILPSTVHIKVKKAKGPIYFHFTKQFQPLDSVDEIRSCQTSSSSISSIEFKRTWDQELRKLRKRDKKQSSPTCSKGTLCISVSCVRAPVLDLLHMLHPGSFVRHTGDLRTSNLLASHLNSPAQAMKICKDIVSWHQLV